jgi:superfamily II DNA or RNA helicase
MRISFDNVWARVEEAAPEEEDLLENLLTVEHKGDIRCFYSRDHRFFPTGLLQVVTQAIYDAEHLEIHLELIDRRPPVAAEAELDRSLVPWMSDKWDFQWDAVAQLLTQNGGRGLLKSPTGSGKTEIFIGLTRLVPVEWLFIVHRADLVEQTAARFGKRTGEQAGIWKNGWQRGTSNCTVATFQAIHSARKRNHPEIRGFLDQIEALNVDEVHAQPANTFYSTSIALKRARWRFGMSGTPLDRSEHGNMRTIAALGPLLHEVPREMLVERGILSQATVKMAPFEHRDKQIPSWSPFEEPPRTEQWRKIYEACVARSEERNELLCRMASWCTRPLFLFVKLIEHGWDLVERLRDHGWRSDFVYGSSNGRQMPVPTRRRKVKELIRGGIDVLVTTVVFQEGIDVPELRGVVVGCGEKSVVGTLQRLGRGMRTDPKTGKRSFEVWDVLDDGQRWLSDHAHKRRAAYEREGYEVKIQRV